VAPIPHQIALDLQPLAVEDLPLVLRNNDRCQAAVDLLQDERRLVGWPDARASRRSSIRCPSRVAVR
jgi:hypothetical protein